MNIETANTELQNEEPSTPQTAEKASSNEAKKYRQRLRESEEQCESLRQQLENLQTESVNAAISGGLQPENGRAVHLKEPTDLFLFTQTSAADYLTESGTVDREKLTTAAQQLTEQRPELAHQPNRVIIPNVGDSPEPSAEKVTFAGAFAPQEPTG